MGVRRRRGNKVASKVGPRQCFLCPNEDVLWLQISEDDVEECQELQPLCNMTRPVAYSGLVEDGIPLADEALHISEQAVFEDKTGEGGRWLVLASLLKVALKRHYHVRSDDAL